MYNNAMTTMLNRIFNEETLSQRKERMIPAAIYGALIGATYTLTLSFINVYTFPKLPLGMDWVYTLTRCFEFSVALALIGAIATWFTEGYEGVVGGGVIVTLLMILVVLVSSNNRDSTVTMQSLITALPLVGVNVLAAWGLRWAAQRHLDITRDEKAELRRKNLTRHVMLILLVGLIPGVLGRMGVSTEQTLKHVNELLQAAPADPSVLPRLPLKQVPALREHIGVSYLLYARPSMLSVGNLDVVVRFADGFSMTCVLPIPGGPFITNCSEGDQMK